MVRKTKKYRDPFAPKPPLNSYMEFSIDERPRVLSDLKNLTAMEVGKEIGLRWKRLSSEEKLKFELKYSENKIRYQEEKSRYDKNTRKQAEESLSPSVKIKKKKSSSALKLPLSSYMEFVKEERARITAELGSLPVVEVGRELGRRWSCLSKEDKEPFEAKSRENRVIYERE